MFSVLFEVHPKEPQWDAYLNFANMLKPELQKIDGFVDNIRYKSLTRQGWILSLSGWRDEKAVVRWRTLGMHHGVQEKGREHVFLDYHLRVGQITSDTKLPTGMKLVEQRLDETEIGEGTTVVMIDAKQAANLAEKSRPEDVASYLGFEPKAHGLATWDVYDAVLIPGDLILTTLWKDKQAAADFAKAVKVAADGRIRTVRVVRDYTMFDRREAPQYYPETKVNN
jgi:heme-degrading monooxygenase HmoA